MTRRWLAELLAIDGVAERVELGSRFGVMAFHGGNLEEGTDDIARSVAERTGASLYEIRQPAQLRWHIPSTRFRVEESDRLAAFVEHVEVVATIHGFGRRQHFRTILLGGRNRELAGVVAERLRHVLPHYEVIDELADIPEELRGLHPANPVNLPPDCGVQIELPPRVRGNGPFWSLWDGGFPTPHTEDLISGLTDAVTAWTNASRREALDDPPATDAAVADAIV